MVESYVHHVAKDGVTNWFIDGQSGEIVICTWANKIWDAYTGRWLYW